MKKALYILFLLVGQFSFLNAFTQSNETLKTEDILNMTLTDLLNIQVVTASKTEQSIDEVPTTVHVITEDQINERAYFTLEEALSDLPGFQFRNINGFNSYIFMRGAPSQNNLIILMVDGVQINELNSGGFYGGGQFIMSDIKQIEVVYGPASALYGTNAVSGIINIITKDPEKKEAHIRLQGGNFKTGMLNFNFKDKLKNDVAYSFSGQYKTSEKADLAGAKGDFNWTEEMENFENDLSFSARIKIKNFKTGIDFQEKRSSMTTNFKSIDDIYLDKNTLWNIFFLNTYATYSKNFHKRWTFKSTAYYRNATVKPNTIDAIIKATETDLGTQIGYYRPNQLMGIENQLNYNSNEKFMAVGGLIGEAEWLSEEYSITYSSSQETKPPAPTKPEILNNSLFSYYALLKYNFIKQLSFNGGIRHDFSSYYGNVFVPRLGIIYNTGKFSAKVLYNKAFRAPKPWDYYYGTGNDDLNPEKMKSWEISVSYQAGSKFNFGGSVYLNEINNKLTKETTEHIERWINKDELNTTGCELYINYISAKLSLFLNYTYNDSRDQNKEIIPEISRHSANAGITYSLFEDMRINIRANYFGERENPGLIPVTGDKNIDNALIFQGCLTYSAFKNFVFQIKTNNIFNSEYYHPSNRFSGRYRQPQRTISLIATYNFAFNKRLTSTYSEGV